MKYEYDERALRDKVENLTLDELKEFAYKALRTKELSRIRKQHERKLLREKKNNEKENI